MKTCQHSQNTCLVSYKNMYKIISMCLKTWKICTKCVFGKRGCIHTKLLHECALKCVTCNIMLTCRNCSQFPRVKDTSFTGVTVEECKLLLSGMDTSHFYLRLWTFIKSTLVTVNICFFFNCTGSLQQMDEDKKGLWKTLMERFSKSSEDVPEKSPEK